MCENIETSILALRFISIMRPAEYVAMNVYKENWRKIPHLYEAVKWVKS